MIPTYRRLGDGDVQAGFVALGRLSYPEAHAEVVETGSQNPEPRGASQEMVHVAGAHPVSCVDCHDPESMALRVTRPGFLTGIASLAAGDAPVPHLPSVERWRSGDRARAYDPNRDASRQELRSFVCGQCHVEYYCGPKLMLFFPWAQGLRVEQIEATYDRTTFADGQRFYDWQHAETGAELLKAQHPEFETWSQGIHARAGVACADCHMPYQREGALKVSDHWVRSPLLNVSRACQACHPVPEAELQARVATIQDRTQALMQRAAAAVIDMLDAIAVARANGASDAAGGGRGGAAGPVAGMGAASARAAGKAAFLRGSAAVGLFSQVGQLKHLDAIIQFEPESDLPVLATYADTWQGIVSCDDNRFFRNFWEVDCLDSRWRRTQQPPQSTSPFTGKSQVILWENGAGSLHRDSKAHNFPPKAALGRPGIAVQRMGDLNVSLMDGEVFGDHVAPLIPKDSSHLLAIWAYAESGELAQVVKSVDRQVKVAVRSLLKVPFDVARWTAEAKRLWPEGVPEPESDDPTQFVFAGWADGSTAALSIAVPRLLGYRWPAELDPSIRLSTRARELVQRCAGLAELADKDGIVCIPSVRGEKPAADRLLALLSACGLKPGRDLETWLRDECFAEHCRIFDQRPFIWHIWDGRSDGFHALVNYHKLAGVNGEGRRTLEALTYSYLGDWINRQKVDQRDGRVGADARLAAAQDLQAQLQHILAGEPPYDIFVRWKPLQKQPIGWDPDINDGVRVNIRPFMSVELRKGGRAGAGVLRWKPNINWKKNSGSELEDGRPFEAFPWFWGCPGQGSLDERTNFKGGTEFDGCRWNDLHYSPAEKRAARAKADGGGK